jgi:hypothetical protein
MHTTLITGPDLIRIARTPLYDREQLWLRTIGSSQAISLAREMERAIVANEGFPVGSHYMRPKLQLFSSDEWQEVIDLLEKGGKGDAALALAFIEYQMAYRRNELAIIYTVVPMGATRLIVLDSIQFPGKPLYC